jgi:hypothetical protein
MEPNSYAATVLFADPSKQPVFMPLPADGRQIASEVDSVRGALKEAEGLVDQAGGIDQIKRRAPEFAGLMLALRRSLLDPIDAEVRAVHPSEKILGSKSWLLLAPIARTWLVPFAAMKTGTAPFAILERKISYQISGRELVLGKSRPGADSLATGLLVTAPDFGGGGSSRLLGGSAGPPSPPTPSEQALPGETRLVPRLVYQLRPFSGLRETGHGHHGRRRVVTTCWGWFPVIVYEPEPVAPHPGSGGSDGAPGSKLAGAFGDFGPDDLQAIGNRLAGALALRVDGPVKVLAGGQATEAAIRDVASRPGSSTTATSPSVLVFCTHGFYLDLREDPKAREAFEGAPVEVGLDPLYHVGLALAGANRTSKILQANAPADDLLTGGEVARLLELSGTDLVVLVACQTGVGQIANGNNLASLRHAFTLAGARSVVASSWKVEADHTGRLISQFFAALHRSGTGRGDREEALQRAQTLLIEDLGSGAHPYFWASFSLTGLW